MKEHTKVFGKPELHEEIVQANQLLNQFNLKLNHLTNNTNLYYIQNANGDVLTEEQFYKLSLLPVLLLESINKLFTIRGYKLHVVGAECKTCGLIFSDQTTPTRERITQNKEDQDWPWESEYGLYVAD